jgi:predicted acylesterase/phospholipase RssA/CRP-like cAMP-binding protein
MTTAQFPTGIPPDPPSARARRAVLAFLTADAEPGRDALRALDDITGDLQPIRLDKGDVLCLQGTPSDRLFVVVSGRLRIVVEQPDGSRRTVDEVGRGETIGEMGLLTGEPRSATVLASRDTELVALHKDAFDRLIHGHPSVLLRLTRELVGRLRRASGAAPSDDDLLTIALVPLAPDVPIADIAARLAEALAAFGRARHLRARDAEGRDDLVPWLDEQEDAHQLVLYEADHGLTPWTARCVRQADRVVLVGRADGDPTPGLLESQLADLEGAATAARRELLLVHADAAARPRNTEEWLARREVEAHHHVVLDRPEHVARLARMLTGRGVGLVLGGGAARGFTHIGVVRALRELGVPIDIVGGTSIGSILAGLVAFGQDDRQMLKTCHQWVASNPMNDYTLPLVSLMTASRLVRSLQSIFGDARIEDLWTDFYCVSSSITRGAVVVHRRGSLVKAIRASSSVPGMAPPVPDGDDLLIDGGVLNNLPADVMRRLCPRGQVIAVDVNPRVGPTTSADYGMSLSAWRVLRSRLNPFAPTLRVPGIQEVLERMTMLASIQQSAEVVRSSVDLYLHPPTDQFQLFDLKAIDSIAEVGYTHARPLIAEWAAGR